MKVRIHEHTTYHYCDDCGISSSPVYKLSGDCGTFTHGDPAYCYGTEDGDIEIVIEELFERLRQKGYNVNVPEMKDNDIDSVLEYDKFFRSNGFVYYLRSIGVNLKLTYSSEKYPDVDDDEIEIIDEDE